MNYTDTADAHVNLAVALAARMNNQCFAVRVRTADKIPEVMAQREHFVRMAASILGEQARTAAAVKQQE